MEDICLAIFAWSTNNWIITKIEKNKIMISDWLKGVLYCFAFSIKKRLVCTSSFLPWWWMERIDIVRNVEYKFQLFKKKRFSSRSTGLVYRSIWNKSFVWKWYLGFHIDRFRQHAYSCMSTKKDFEIFTKFFYGMKLKIFYFAKKIFDFFEK